MLAHPILLKFRADNLVRALGAKPEDEGPRRKLQTDVSPLREFDLQKVEFPDAWLKRLDARAVDFFKANLRKASLREAFLSKAVFYETNLQEAILCGADLTEANLSNANLHKADLRDADLRQANFRQACLTEVKLNGAKVAGADVREVQWGMNPDGYVDVSPSGDGSQMKTVRAWIQ
ncbi:MAG: pentapeptide repeat-containing protein [Candidatus Binatia bacterium]